MITHEGYCRALGGKVYFDVERVVKLDTKRGIKWQVKGQYKGHNISTFTSEEKALILTSQLDSQPQEFNAETIWEYEEVMPYFGSVFQAEEVVEEIEIESIHEDLAPQEDTKRIIIHDDVDYAGLDLKYLKKDGSPDMRYKICREWAIEQEVINEPDSIIEDTEYEDYEKIFRAEPNDICFSDNIPLESWNTMSFDAQESYIASRDESMISCPRCETSKLDLRADSNANAECENCVFEGQFAAMHWDIEETNSEPPMEINVDEGKGILPNFLNLTIPKITYYEIIGLIPEGVMSNETIDGASMTLTYLPQDAKIMEGIAGMDTPNSPAQDDPIVLSAEDQESFKAEMWRGSSDGDVITEKEYFENIFNMSDDTEVAPLPTGELEITEGHINEVESLDAESFEAETPLREYSFYGYSQHSPAGQMSKDEALELLKTTQKPIKYTSGWKHRGAETAPITRENAIEKLVNGMVTVTEYSSLVDVNSFSALDMGAESFAAEYSKYEVVTFDDINKYRDTLSMHDTLEEAKAEAQKQSETIHSPIHVYEYRIDDDDYETVAKMMRNEGILVHYIDKYEAESFGAEDGTRTFRITDITYDTYDEEAETETFYDDDGYKQSYHPEDLGLPEEGTVVLEQDEWANQQMWVLEERVIDKWSDESGWCIYGAVIEEITPAESFSAQEYGTNCNTCGGFLKDCIGYVHGEPCNQAGSEPRLCTKCEDDIRCSSCRQLYFHYEGADPHCDVCNQIIGYDPISNLSYSHKGWCKWDAGYGQTAGTCITCWSEPWMWSNDFGYLFFDEDSSHYNSDLDMMCLHCMEEDYPEAYEELINQPAKEKPKSKKWWKFWNAESFKEWADEEGDDEEHGDNPTFEEWVDEEIEEHGDVKLSKFKEIEINEPEHYDAEIKTLLMAYVECAYPQNLKEQEILMNDIISGNTNITIEHMKAVVNRTAPKNINWPEWVDKEEEEIYEDIEWESEEVAGPKPTTIAALLAIGGLAAYFAPDKVRNFFKAFK